jgi:5,6,7,8-tetrahydromethanopterin hydro-lyase
MSRDLDGVIGEGWAGEVPNGVHVNLVIGRRGTPTAAAAVNALASPRPGIVPFLACLDTGNLVRPATIVINKAAITRDTQGALVWGAVQLGISHAVMDAVADGGLTGEEAAELTLLVLAYIDPVADDEKGLRIAARSAMRDAIVSALAPPSREELDRLCSIRASATNVFWTGG